LTGFIELIKIQQRKRLLGMKKIVIISIFIVSLCGIIVFVSLKDKIFFKQNETQVTLLDSKVIWGNTTNVALIIKNQSQVTYRGSISLDYQLDQSEFDVNAVIEILHQNYDSNRRLTDAEVVFNFINMNKGNWDTRKEELFTSILVEARIGSEKRKNYVKNLEGKKFTGSATGIVDLLPNETKALKIKIDFPDEFSGVKFIPGEFKVQ
jgi:hypothetical protein